MTKREQRSVCVGDIIAFVAAKIGIRPSDFPDGGVITGSATAPVRGVLVTWMATAQALQAAVARGLNAVLCHESFLFNEKPELPPYRWSSPPDEKPRTTRQHPNQIRLRVARKNRLTVFQIHYGLDRLCLCDDFMKYIGITRVFAGAAYEKVYVLPKALTADDLARQVAARLGLPYVLVSGNGQKVISKVGNLWGGAGLSRNRYWMRRQIELGVEAIICGEADENAGFFAQEFRETILIETSHVTSENVGLRQVSAILQKAFPALRIEFFEVDRLRRLLTL